MRRVLGAVVKAQKRILPGVWAHRDNRLRLLRAHTRDAAILTGFPVLVNQVLINPEGRWRRRAGLPYFAL